MEAEEVKILRDLQAYITLGILEDKSFDEIIANVYHDANGIVRDKDCFLPLSNDYMKHLEATDAHKQTAGA